MKSSTQRLANQEDVLSRHIPMSARITSTVVSARTGDYMSTWQIDGLAFDGLSIAEAYGKMEAFNVLVRSLSNGKFAFWVHRLRRFTGARLTAPEETFAQHVVEKYYEQLNDEGLMATEIYLTILYRPFPQKAGRLSARAAHTVDEMRHEELEILERMGDLQKQVTTSLGSYGPNLLTDYESEGITYSRQQEFYGYLINGAWRPVPVKDVPLHQYLSLSRVLFGNEIVETRGLAGTHYSTFIDIKDYAEYSEPGILNTMIALPFEYIETQSFSPKHTMDALAALRIQRRRLASADDGAVSQIVELDAAIDGVISGSFAFGEYHYVMQIIGDTVKDVKDCRAIALERMQSIGFLGVPVDLVVDQAYLSQLPGNWRARPRSAHLSSRNFAGLCSLHNFQPGKPAGNPWGEAVTIFRTPAAQPYYFNFHATPLHEDSTGQSALGNCQIIGQSGSGKTVLALYLLLNLRKYGTQVVYFDKDRGAEIAIRASGGKYLSLRTGEPTQFNPFKMEPTDGNLLFWYDLVRFCTYRAEMPHSPREEAEINHAVRAVARLPRELRGFEAVIQNLPNVDQNSVAERLKRWTASGSLGWALDCADDALEFDDGGIFGFDYTDLLDDPATCPAIMIYLMYRVEAMIDGRRFAFFMDEYWKALSVSYFEDFAKNKQKTIRKQNGFGVYMTQSPSDTLRSPIARALIEQTATFIFLPNPTADEGDYIEGFKLTQTEFELLKGLGEGSRQFLIKQGDAVSLASFNLSGFDEELKVLSGTTANVQKLDGLRSIYGDDPADWMPHFLE